MSNRIITLGFAAAVLGGFALPAAAQDLCGGLGASGVWIGGSSWASDIANASDYAEQLAQLAAGEAHVALFSLSAPADVRLEAVAHGTGDPMLRVLDEAGTLVGRDDDSGGGTAPRAELSLAPGTYCIEVTSFGRQPLTGTLRIGRTEHAALTGPNTPAPPQTPPETPTAISVCDGPAMAMAQGPVDGLLPNGIAVTNPIESTPNYSFTLTTPASVTLRAENPDADPVLTLTDASGRVIAENDDYDGLNARIDVIDPLAPGDYCIGLRAWSDPTLPVTVTLVEYDPQAAARERYDRGDVAPPLDGSYPVTDLGGVNQRLVSDAQLTGGNAKWFRIDVDQSSLLLIEAFAGSFGDPVLRLFDDVGRAIAQNDDYGGSLDSLIAVRVFPGTYLIALSDYSNSNPLLRLVVERYIPAD